MSYEREFKTVDVLVGLGADTSIVDAFALSLIKAERQMRRLFTYLVYQSPRITRTDVPALIAILADKVVYFDGLVIGVNELSPTSVEGMIGSEHERLWGRLDKLRGYRNKIFHGQLTGKALGSEELRVAVVDTRLWCKLLAKGASHELGYDGFARNSFRKAVVPQLAKQLRRRFDDVSQYAKFIEDAMEHRKRKPRERQGKD